MFKTAPLYRAHNVEVPAGDDRPELLRRIAGAITQSELAWIESCLFVGDAPILRGTAQAFNRQSDKTPFTKSTIIPTLVYPAKTSPECMAEFAAGRTPEAAEPVPLPRAEST